MAKAKLGFLRKLKVCTIMSKKPTTMKGSVVSLNIFGPNVAYTYTDWTKKVMSPMFRVPPPILYEVQVEVKDRSCCYSQYIIVYTVRYTNELLRYL